MEKILLCDAFNAVCAHGESIGIHLFHYSAHPYVNGKSIDFIKAVKKSAFGNLCTYTADFLQLFSAEFDRGVGNFIKINLAARNLLGGINNILCSEACTQRRKVFCSE